MQNNAELYAYVDKVAPRSLPDIVKSTAMSLGLPDWTSKFLRTLCGGIGIVECQTDMDKNKRAESIGRYVYEGKFIHKLLEGRNSSHLKRGTVIAAIIKTYQVDYKKGTEDAIVFWTQVRDGANLSADSPALKLHHFLLLSTVKNLKGLSGGRDTQAVGERAMMAKCIIAWNAFRRKEATRLQYYPDKPVPQPI